MLKDKNLTLETLLETQDLWDYEELDENPNFDWSWVQTLPDKPWPWEHFHSHQKFNFSWVNEFPDKPWNWFAFRTADFSFVNRFRHKLWDWQTLSISAKIHHLLKYPDMPWDWTIITIFSDIETDVMMQYDHLPWDVDQLSFTIIDEKILKYINHFKDRFTQPSWNDFSHILPWSIFKENQHLPWNISHIRFHETIDENDFMTLILEKYGFRAWDWKYLSKHTDIHVIIKYNMFPWDENTILVNETLRYEHLRFFRTIGKKSKSPCESKEYIVKLWHSACVIQRAWRMCYINPAYAMCKRFNTRFISELNQYPCSSYT